jgi:tripartite-type tricarboxylate transporter receptor subunit TctC
MKKNEEKQMVKSTLLKSLALSVSAVSLAVLTPAVVFAQAWPTKPIKLIVPFPPGGTTDILARPLAQKLQEALGQPVIVENRGGAGGTIGADVVAKSAADGYTFLVGATHHAIAHSLYTKLPYDINKDLTPITVIAYVPNILVASPSFVPKTVAEVLAAAKLKPNGISYGSAGNGTTHHMGGEMFKWMGGVELTHVPYKGGGPMMADLIGNQVQLAFETAPSATQQIKAGKIKAIAVTTDKRLPNLPDVPTIKEAGLKDFELVTYYGLFAPASTPKNIIDRVHTETKKILESPDMKQRILDMNSFPGGTLPGDFAKELQIDIEKFAKVVKASGATID